ncbi:MFS transporter [Mycolicibacterium sediminis]|uniref:MFS transporter n=1 Tax=Mycolicibacterium sediminis TaxID=1286180 RepID=A0A7I7QLC0_9MYCO|nr:MFS transporter [Mycolicibacterium sediminis]BBY27169.1 MFS transporter [Mycolicibacterium sediminis]
MSRTDASRSPQEVESGSPDRVRVTIASSIGATVENYDFLIFGTAAALYLGPAFFPSDHPLTGTLLAFATLAVGFVMRPVGGIIGGHFGDRVGRKPVLVVSLLVMGLATVAIGFLPTFDQVGILAPILLVAVRLVQGIALGAEWGGAILMAFEHAPRRRKGVFAAIPQAGVPLGLLLANLAFFATANVESSLAWRIPFMLSAILVGIGIFIRLRLSESPEFEDVTENSETIRFPVLHVLRHDSATVLRVIGLRMAETCAFYITVTFLLSYLAQSGVADKRVGLTAIIVASAIGLFTTPFFGALSDRFGRRPVYIAGCLVTTAIAFPLFWMVNSGSVWLIVLGVVLAQAIAHDCLAGVQGAYFSELFNTRTRQSGASLGYQLSASISGFIPLIASALAASVGWVGVAGLMAVVGLIGLVSAMSTRETWPASKRSPHEVFGAPDDEPGREAAGARVN